MLLHDDPGADVIKVTITEKEAGIAIHDMKLPDDIQVLTIQRGLTPIVPHGELRVLRHRMYALLKRRAGFLLVRSHAATDNGRAHDLRPTEFACICYSSKEG